MERRERKPLRLSGCDYAENGIYFITICTHHMQHTLCTIQCRGGPCGLPRTVLSPLGKLAEEAIGYIDSKENVTVDHYVIMPNHIHLLIRLHTPFEVPPTEDICRIIGGYKSKVATDWFKACKESGRVAGSVWQRSFMDHIIRNKADYLQHWQYIENNPLKWENDKYFTKNDISFW